MRFVIRRAGVFLLTLWAALSLNFFLPRLMPGSPADRIIAHLHGAVSQSTVRAIELSLGINNDQSVWKQYLTYLGHTATGNLGFSYSQGEPVSKVIAGALPWTLGLVGITTILAFILGTAIGAVAPWRRGGRFDSITPRLFCFTTAIPFFWVGMVLILIFSVQLGWLPVGGNIGQLAV